MPPDWLREVCQLEPGPSPEALAEEGLTVLRSVVSVVGAAEDNDTATAAVSAYLLDTDAVKAGAHAVHLRPAAVTGLITDLGRRRGFKGQADRLLDVLKQEARAAERAARRAMPQAVELGGGPLAETVARDDLPAGLACPPGWEVGLDGVLRVHVDDDSGDARYHPVSSRPVLVTGVCRDVADGQTSLHLEWSTRRGWRRHIAARSQVMDARSLVALSGLDAPVHSNNARDLVQFLADFEATNLEALPEARVSSAMGWQGRDGRDGFLWGRAHLLPGQPSRAGQTLDETAPSEWGTRQVHLLVDAGGSDLADGFVAGGTFDGWRSVVEEALPFPPIVLGLYASLVPPLMVCLPTLPNFIVDFAGPTSEGKTTTLRLAASAWGLPDERGGGILRSWDATRVWIERTAALLGNLPLLLDDTKRARRPEEVGRVLYDVANGLGRGRGSTTGLRGLGRWRTVLLSTGEAPATSFTNDGGTRARTLCLWGSPFGGASVDAARVARRITEGTLAHHGHAGPALVRWLLDTPDARGWVQRAYGDALDRWVPRADGNAVAGRAAQYVAGLEVAQQVLHDVLGVPRPAQDPLEHAWAAVTGASKDADRAADALRDLLSWATSQQARFHGRQELEGGTEDAPSGGWLGAWQCYDGWRYLAVLPTELRGFLSREGYDADAIVRTWLDRGWLLRDGAHRTRKVTVGNRKERCFAIDRAACEQVWEDGDA